MNTKQKFNSTGLKTPTPISTPCSLAAVLPVAAVPQTNTSGRAMLSAWGWQQAQRFLEVQMLQTMSGGVLKTPLQATLYKTVHYHTDFDHRQALSSCCLWAMRQQKETIQAHSKHIPSTKGHPKLHMCSACASCQPGLCQQADKQLLGWL